MKQKMELIMAAKRTDHNQVEIVSALRDAGTTVTILAGVGGGCPDLLVGWRGKNYLLEVKNPAGMGDLFTAAELEWIQSWRGQVTIVHDIDEALAALEGAYEPQTRLG
jgi:hypothetical protein